jgi:Skp family chaperone for outer membrane proteins
MSFSSGLRPLLAFSALLAASHVAFGQAKTAVVNMQAAVFATAEIKKADAELQAIQKSRIEVAQQLSADLTSISTQLQDPKSKLTEAQQEELNFRGQKEKRDLDRLQQDLTDEATRAREEVIPRITQKMVEVVKKLADVKALDLVIDTANVVFSKQAMDITAEAIAAYDKQYPAPLPAGAAPAAPAPKK